MLSTKLETESNNELDLHTIRQRVAAIKRNWTPSETRMRAIEGRLRRKQLEELILAAEHQHSDSECSLVC